MTNKKCKWCCDIFGNGHSLSRNLDATYIHKKEVLSLFKDSKSCGYSNGSGGLCGCVRPELEEKIESKITEKEVEYI